MASLKWNEKPAPPIEKPASDLLLSFIKSVMADEQLWTKFKVCVGKDSTMLSIELMKRAEELERASGTYICPEGVMEAMLTLRLVAIGALPSDDETLMQRLTKDSRGFY
jgi:hypothetical protein